MKLIHFIVILAGWFGFQSLRTTAQENALTLPITNYSGISLPPLNEVLDSAIANNNSLKYLNLDILAKEINLKASRVAWTRNLGIQSDLRYGTFDNFTTNTAEGQYPSIRASQSTQLNYGVGAYIKVPIIEIISRKNQVDLAKTELLRAQSMADSQRDELVQLIIRLYNDAMLKQNLVGIKAKYYETASINLEMAEKEFRNGMINLSEYTRISQITSSAEADIETARIDFMTAYMVLEVIAGVNFAQNIQP
jgi:outer membrane protein TolC